MKNQNLFLDCCAWFAQLPDGRWGGDSFSGWKVSIDVFQPGERPDRFKFEPARRATDEEATWLRQEARRIEGLATGEVFAEEIDTHSGVELFGVRKTPVEDAEWNPLRRQWEIQV